METFVKVEDLKVGDSLIERDGFMLEVTQVEAYDTSHTRVHCKHTGVTKVNPKVWLNGTRLKAWVDHHCEQCAMHYADPDAPVALCSEGERLRELTAQSAKAGKNRRAKAYRRGRRLAYESVGMRRTKYGWE